MERVSAQCCCIQYIVIEIFDCNCNNRYCLLIQVAKHEEEVSRLQSELHHSAAHAEKQLTVMQKLETEHSSLHDELNTLKDEVCNLHCCIEDEYVATLFYMFVWFLLAKLIPR